MISRSVAQIATASMRTSTSALPGIGTAFSTSESWPGSPSTQAFIRSGMGNSGAVVTPAGAYISCSSFSLRASRVDRDHGSISNRLFVIARLQVRAKLAKLRREIARSGDDSLSHQLQTRFGRPHGGGRSTDCPDHGAGVVADRCADTNDPRLKLLVVEREPIAPNEAEFFDELLGVGERHGREPHHPVQGQNPTDLLLRQPCKHRLAGRGRVRRVGDPKRSGVDAKRVARIALEQGDDRVPLHNGEVHRFTGGLVDPVQYRPGAMWQIDLLEKRVTEMEDTRPERVGAVGKLRRIAPLHQSRQQMMTGRDIEAGYTGQGR